MACDPTINFGPTSPGWIATTACNSTPYQYPLTAEPVNATACIIGDPVLPGYAPCGCYVGAWWSITPPPRCPVHAESATPFAPMMPTTTTTTLRLTPTAPQLSDSDVDRIARRVVELLREPKP